MSGETQATVPAGGLDFQKQVIDPIVEDMKGDLGKMTEEVTQRVMQHVDTQLNALRAPERQSQMVAQELFGGTPNNPNTAPGVRIGENPLTSRGYSLLRAAGLMSGNPNVEPEHCKTEMAVHRQLSEFYSAHGFTFGSSRGRSMLVPFGTNLLPEGIEDGGGDRYSRQDIASMLQQSIAGVQPDRLQSFAARAGINANRVNQALSIFDESKMGVFTTANLGELIELVRNAEVLSRINVREVTLPPNGTLVLPRQTGATTAGWIGEAATIATSEPTTGNLTMRAKKGAVLSLIPNELLRFATSDSEAFLRADMAAVLARLVDTAFFSGVGATNSPMGILNNDNVPTKVAGTVDTDGNTLEPNDPSGMIAEVEEADHDVDGRGWVWVMRGKLWQNILNRRAASVSSGDQEGPYLFPVERGSVSTGTPDTLRGWPVVRSNAVPNNRVKGASSDLTALFGGIPDDVILARAGVLEFATASEGTVNSSNLFESDQSALRAIEFADIALRHEDSWIYIDQIDPDLPAGVI